MGYAVFKRETTRVSWTPLTQCSETLTWTADKLLPGNEYQFRVQAVNKFGVGEGLDSIPCIAENKFTVPMKPGRPGVQNVTANSCSLA